MVKIKYYFLLFFAVSVFYSGQTYAQSFGFGCLGFVGGFGGFSYQKYGPSGLNSYIKNFNEIRNDSLTTPMGNFGTAKGYRVGLNFFRAKFTNFILTAKGFYETLNEKHESIEKLVNGTRTNTFEVGLKNWGIGVDIGLTITNGLSWKIIDGALHFNSATFTDTQNAPGVDTKVTEYKNTSSSLGYSIGTGFILSLIEDYISLEGTAGYTSITIDQMQSDKGALLTVNENSSTVMKNFIDNGGFSAVVQLNVGFPL